MNFKHLGTRTIKAIVFGLLDAFFSKDPLKVVLVVKNRTEFSGNLRVACDILLNENTHSVFIYKDGKCVPEIKKTLEEKGATVLEGWSIYTLYHLLTSGFFIFSHAPRDAHITKKHKNRIVINLWHGVAIKTIENLMPDISEVKQKQIENNAKLFNRIIASSLSDKQTNMKAFMLEEDKVKIIGLPRYEILKNSYPLDDFLQKQKQKLLSYKKNKTLILYAPTFREKNTSAIEQMAKSDWDILSSMLVKSNAVMAIRPHSYDTDLPSYLKGNKNFCWLPHLKFTETNLVLQLTDILVVDFSSIWVDYLLLNRPIVGFAKDYEHYLNSERGFVYDFKSIFPDKFYYSTKNLTKHLEKLLSEKTEIKNYQTATSFFHRYDLTTNFTLKLKTFLDL